MTDRQTKTNPINPALGAVIYTRVSTGEQDKHGTSPELQSLPASLDSPASPFPNREGSALVPGVGSEGLTPTFLTMDEAAALLRVSKATIRRRIRDGELPAKRLRGGQTVLIEQSDVLALLDDITPGTDV